ncbi:MAG: transporter substrate-binding domain-containing protein [Bacillota bacterium]
MLRKRIVFNVMMIVFLGIFVFFVFQPLAYAHQGVKLRFKGETVETDPAPVFVNNRIMVPVRDLANCLEASVNWDAEKGQVTVSKNLRQMSVTVGENQGVVDGEKVQLDSAPVIVNNRVMVPLRFFGEFCGLSVSWDRSARIVSLEKKPLVAGSSVDFPPFEFREGDEIVGFDIDLIKAIEELTGENIIVKDVRFDGLIPSLLAGEVDMVVSQLTITEERKEYFGFTEPYFTGGQVIITTKDMAVDLTLDDLAGKHVAYQDGTLSQELVMTLQEKFPGTKGLGCGTLEEVWKAVEEGIVDAAIVPHADTAYFYLQNREDSKLRIASELLSIEQTGIAVRKEDQELLEMLNKSLETLKENGTYDRIFEKWFGSY